METKSDDQGLVVKLSGIPVPMRRTGNAIDKLFALPIEAVAKFVEEKLSANVASHVDAVQEKKKRKNEGCFLEELSLEEINEAQDWARGAAEVDSSEDDLAAVWRAILDEILEKQSDAKDLLRIARALPSSDMRYFIRRFAMRPQASWGEAMTVSPPLERLKAQGLVVRTFNPAVATFVLGMVMVCLALIDVYNRRIFEVVWSFSGSFPVFTISIAFASVLLAISIGARFHRATRFGRRLAEKFREYYYDEDFSK